MKKIFAVVLIMLFICIPLQIPDNATDNAADTQVAGVFATTSVKQVQVTASKVNFRTGASTNHRIITTYKKGTVLDVIGKIGRWYVVKNSKDTVGCVSGNMVQPYTPSSSGTSSFSSMQTEMLGYINAARKASGLSPLTLNTKLCDGAYLKSKDMAVNNYFSHTSPTYGSPFNMMQSLGISYSAAGENIAMHSSVKGAHDALMNSSGHRANILSQNFSKVGLGFYQEGKSLYVTQWFTN